MPGTNFLSSAFVADGTVAIDRLSDQLHVTRMELALAASLVTLSRSKAVDGQTRPRSGCGT
jgi:hypothetical protein